MTRIRDDIVPFLRARLADDEQAARAAAEQARHEQWSAYGSAVEEVWSVGAPHPDHPDGSKWYRLGGELLRQSGHRHLAEHVARHDPERVLREIAAKRQIIDLAAEASGLRHALAGLIAGLTGLIVGTAPAPKRQCGERSGFRFGDPPRHHRCDRPRGHDGSHEAGGVGWGEIAAPWPAREDLPEEEHR